MSKITIKIKDSQENLINTRYEEYDNNNNLLSLELVNPDGKVIQSEKRSYEYDSNNKIVKEIIYNSDGSVSKVWEYSYTE